MEDLSGLELGKTMPDISEKNFEATIESLLLAGGVDDPETARSLRERMTVADGAYISGGYTKRISDQYDKSLCLIPKDVLDFILITNPKNGTNSRRTRPTIPSRIFSTVSLMRSRNMAHCTFCVMASKVSAVNSTLLTLNLSQVSTPKFKNSIKATSSVSCAS